MNRLPFTCISTVFLTGILVYVSGCDNTFEPFQENDRYVFSMYGTVDLHADTQWVRVMPVAQTLLQEQPESNEATVTLIRESTGEEIEMQDSLFQFATDAFVWNYWIDNYDVNPREAYTLTATSLDGKQSSATVTTPSPLPVPEFEFDPEWERGVISGSFQDSLIALETRYEVQYIIGADCSQVSEFIFSHMDRIEEKYNASFNLEIDHLNQLQSTLGVSDFRVVSRTLVIVTSEKDWPYLRDYSEVQISLPETVTNVTTGTGFVPGIAKREVALTPTVPKCLFGPGGPGWPRISTD